MIEDPLGSPQASLIWRCLNSDRDAFVKIVVYLAELVVFGVFSIATVLVVPNLIIRVLRISRPDLQISDLSAVDQVLMQGALSIVLLTFMGFLVKAFHRSPFWEWIHWIRNHDFRTGFLITLGSALALTGLLVSAIFPPNQPPPIERLLSSPGAVYAFAVYGIGLAPLFEEILFRGFLFRLLFDLAGRVVAMLATATLFAALHVVQLWGSWAGIVLIFLVGCILSFVRYRSNSLIPSFIIHTAYNSTLFGLFAISSLFPKGTS